jgi:hypothetical protein
MEEDILDIHLVDCLVQRDRDRERERESEGEDDPNSGEIDNNAGGLIIVHSGTLSEAPKDPTNHVAIERAIRGELVVEDPLADNHIGAQ